MDLNATCGSGPIFSAILSQIANCSGDWTPTLRRPSSFQSVLYLLALAIIVLTSFVGNLLVLVAVIWTPGLHRTNNALMVSLAVADLLRTATVMPIHGYLRLTADDTATVSPGGGNVLCPIHYALLVGLDVTVVLSVTLIGIERVCIIVRPLKYICIVTRTKLCLTIGGIWAAGLVNGAIHIIRPHDNSIELPVTSLTSQPLTFTVLDHRTCRRRMTSTADAISYFLFLFVIPLVVIVGCYGKIFLVVGYQIRRMNNNPTVNPNTKEQSESRWHPENSLCENGGSQSEGCSPRSWVTTVTARSRADGTETGRLAVARTAGSDLIGGSSLFSFKDIKVEQLKETMKSLRLPQRRSRAVHHPFMPIILENYWKKRRKNKVEPPMQSPPNLRRPQCMPLETVASPSKPSVDRLKAFRPPANKRRSLGIVIEKSCGASDVTGTRSRDMPDDVFKMAELRTGRVDRGRSLPLLLTGKGGGQVTPDLTATSRGMGEVSSNQTGTRKPMDKSHPSGPLKACPRVAYRKNRCIEPAVLGSDCGVRCDSSGRSTSCIGTISYGPDIGTVSSNGSTIRSNGSTGYEVSGGSGFDDVSREGEGGGYGGSGCGGGGGAGGGDSCGSGVCVTCDNGCGSVGCDTQRITHENQTNLSANGAKDHSLDLNQSGGSVGCDILPQESPPPAPRPVFAPLSRLLSPIQSTTPRSVEPLRPDVPFPTARTLILKPAFHFTWALSPRKELTFPRSGVASLGLCRPAFAPSPRSPRRLIADPFSQNPDHPPPPPPALRRTESVSSRATVNSFLGSPRPSLLVRLTGNRALKMMFIVVSSFLASWLPLQICHVLSFFCSEDLASSAAWDLADLCVFLGSALHPIIYEFYSSEFRRALRSVLWPRRRTSGSMGAVEV